MNVTRIMIAMSWLALLGLACGCNPTWTNQGTPNQSSMPLPPDATPPAQTQPVAGSQASG